MEVVWSGPSSGLEGCAKPSPTLPSTLSTSEGRRLEKHTLKTVSTDITDSNTTDSFNNFWIIYKARIQIAILNQIIPFTNKRVVYVMLITNTAYLNI